MKNYIRNEFDKVPMPHDCADKIRQSMEQQPIRRKSLSTLSRILIAAAMTLCLLASVAAVGIQKGWLDDFLGNSETVADVNELQLTTQDGKAEITFDRMLVDGPFVYLQVSVRTKGNVNAAEAFEGNSNLPESSIEDRLHTTYTDGSLLLPLSEQGQKKTKMSQLSSDGPTRTWYVTRLDDGSDPNYCSYTMQIVLGDLPADYEGLNLTLHLDQHRDWTLEGDVYTTQEKPVPLMENHLTLSDAKARVTTTEDGRQVKIHTLGVQIHGADFAVYDANYDWNSGVVLKDGTKLPFKPGMSAQNYFAEEMQWNVCLLNEMINPEEVAAIYTGDTVYPLN